MKQDKDNHVKRVIRWLTNHGTITSREAIELFGCYRLADVILRIRRMGIEVETEMISVKNRYGGTSRIARYRLV